MALWLVRAGKLGEYEERFLAGGRIYLTWQGGPQQVDLSGASDRAAIRAAVEQAYPEAPEKRVVNNTGQILAFVVAMSAGDWVALPRKNRTIAVGEVTGAYAFDPAARSRIATAEPCHGWRQACLAQPSAKTCCTPWGLPDRVSDYPQRRREAGTGHGRSPVEERAGRAAHAERAAGPAWGNGA